MNVWQDVLSVLMNEWRAIVVILVFIFASQILIVSLLRKIFGDALTSIEYLSLGMGGWTASLLVISLIGYFIGFAGLVLILLLILILILRFKPDFKPAFTSTSLLFTLTVIFSILLRLAYISKTLFPPYFDSATHFLLTKNILNGNVNAASSSYYHLGFHFIVAFFASFLNIEITRVMLILGQIILALLPFSFFFLVRHETKSDIAAWFAVTLSAFGWYMLAHAVDWGKYPALMSVGLIPFVVGVVIASGGVGRVAKHIETKRRESISSRWALFIILTISILASIFIHSRSASVFGILFIVWIISTSWGKLPRSLQVVMFVLALAILILLIIFVQRNQILNLLFDPYINKGIWMTALVLFLSLFSYRAYPKLTFAITLSACLIFISLFIPLKDLVPGYENLTLLDRPFVEVSLFMPLSILGGLGLAGLQNMLQGRFSWGRYVGLLAVGVVIVHAYFTYNLYPSDCCVIVGNDDTMAIDWAANQLPVNARIGIASTELKVVVSNVSYGPVGSDAGIWITSLTDLATIPLRHDFEFDQKTEFEKLCTLRIDHLFVGELGQAFDVAKIDSRPEWYTPLLSMSKTKVYEVVGCDG